MNAALFRRFAGGSPAVCAVWGGPAVIYFDEQSRIIEVQTHNTDLKKRLTAFAAKYPQCCRQTDDDEEGGVNYCLHTNV